jgi:hypothetical protein
MERETRPLSRSKPHPLPPTRRFPDPGKVDRRPRRGADRAPVTCRLLPTASRFHAGGYATRSNRSQNTTRIDRRISVLSLSGALR